MSDWNEDTEPFLDAFREDVDIDLAEADIDAAWARFEDEAVPSEPVAHRRPLLWWATGAAAVAAALALVWFARPGSRVDEAVQPRGGHQAVDEAVDRDSGETPVPAPRPGVSPTSPVPSPRPDVLPEVESEPEPVAETGGVADAPRRRRRAESVKAAGEDTDSTPPAGPSRLAEELRLLESMRASTKAGRFSDALSTVREHAQRYGKGPFAAERELTRVRALCGLGRVADARKAQDRFARSFPGSHLGTLVRGACKAGEEKNTKSDHDE